MIALSREAGLKAPGFRQDGGSFVQTLWRPVPQATGQATTQVTMQDKVLWASAFKELIARATQVTGQVTGQATGQVAVALQAYFAEPKTTKEIQDSLGLSHRETFLDNYLTPMLEAGLLERTIPDKPTSPNQRYRLTAKGRTWLEGAKP